MRTRSLLFLLLFPLAMILAFMFDVPTYATKTRNGLYQHSVTTEVGKSEGLDSV